MSRLSFDFVKNEFESSGYILLSKKYLNNRQKLNYLCPSGHTGTIQWSNWQQGTRCAACFADRQRLDINVISKALDREGYSLLTTVYINAHELLDYICPFGHKNRISWVGWNNGNRCPSCYRINAVGQGSPNWQGGKSFEPYCSDWTKEYKEYIKERDGYKCLNPNCRSENPNDLNVHHINYDKKNCSPSNLITLCRSCNVRANYRRIWHKSFYTKLIFCLYKQGEGTVQ